jgi:hypothetical protein
MTHRLSRIPLRLWHGLPRRVLRSLNLDMSYIFPGIASGSLGLVLLPAKENSSLGRLELRLLFFASLISPLLFVFA